MTLLVATAVLPIASSENKSINNHVIRELFVDEKCKCNNDKVDGKYAQGKFFNHPGLNVLPEYLLSHDMSSRPTIVDTPEYFSWMDYEGQDWTTPAKHQGRPKWCGSCWVFAALGALESLINIKEGIADLDPDLSEQYILSCLPKAGSCQGGSPLLAFKYINSTDSKGNNCNGIIPEACFPYLADDTIPCDAKCENWEEYLVPIGDCGYWWQPDEREAIKSQIMQNGPVVTCFASSYNNFSLWGWSHHSPDDYFWYEEEGGVDHAVIIVGWKDDPSIGNGGYWICKNSFGENFGYNGFFNVEYGSIYIDSYEINWVEYDPEDFDWHPVPKANGPYYGLVDEPVQFQGDAAGEHPPFTWHWDFGDSEISEEQNPSHIYTSPGDYVVTLTVSDSSDNVFSVTTSAWVQETNTPPNTPTIEGPTKVKPEERCWYNISAVDPDGTHFYIYAIVYDIDWGVWWGPIEPGEMDRWHLYWSEEGEYIVKAKAKDSYGAESDWATLEVSVPKNKSINTPFLKFLEQHPLMFPLLRQLLGLQ